ncbi:kinesin family protein [Annulohypoxylon nitens]|nr:kinesin family protein [Annulohypoxylon nitens]
MESSPLKSIAINVHARWRPLAQTEAASGEITRGVLSRGPLLSVSINRQKSKSDIPWTSSPAFTSVVNSEDDNYVMYSSIVAPAVDKVLQGRNYSFFAYGHSGSGKTHTVIGPSASNEREIGAYLAAAKHLFDKLERLNQEGKEQRLGIGCSVFELRGKSAFDLLNGRTECHIREGHDGKTHIRGETEVLDGGKVRVQPLKKRPCWTFESLHEEITEALKLRAVGSSSVHDQSSRTHAVLELEIITQELVDARQAVIDRQSELVPVGKHATTVSIEESMKGLTRTPEGQWVPNPDYTINQARIDAAEAEKAHCEAQVEAAEENVNRLLQSCNHPCLGAKMVFVDLAGAEYFQENGSSSQTPKQTPQERREGRQINTDLLALKEVIRAWSGKQSRIPFRSSPLTMVLRDHFLSSEKGTSIMIVTLSPGRGDYAATLNSLKYGGLVGVAGSK